MDKEKEEGVLGTITDAAKTGMDAAIEGVSSAATAVADAVTDTTKKPQRRRRSTTKTLSLARVRARSSITGPMGPLQKQPRDRRSQGSPLLLSRDRRR